MSQKNQLLICTWRTLFKCNFRVAYLLAFSRRKQFLKCDSHLYLMFTQYNSISEFNEYLNESFPKRNIVKLMKGTTPFTIFHIFKNHSCQNPEYSHYKNIPYFMCHIIMYLINDNILWELKSDKTINIYKNAQPVLWIN